MRIPPRRGGLICDFDRTVTPMVDVVFQLLVFFVLASGGVGTEHALSASFPGGAISSLKTAVAPTRVAGSDSTARKIWIRLAREAASGELAAVVAGQKCPSAGDIANALRPLKNDPGAALVILDVADSVAWGDVVRVEDICRGEGLTAICFAASPEDVATNAP